MKTLHPKLVKLYVTHDQNVTLTRLQRDERLKWLRYYLDFCQKYGHLPRERDSLQPWLLKLASKRQSEAQQLEASRSINVYFDLVSTMTAEQLRKDPNGWPAQYEELKRQIRVRQYSPKTLKCYRCWIRDFETFLKGKSPKDVSDHDAVQFLSMLATERRVGATTQNQAFNALLFLFRHVLKTPYELGDKVVRAKKRRYVPVILSRPEVDAVILAMPPPYRLLVQLLYGCGLRLAEGLNLRVHSFNFDQNVLTVHRGKGGKDRTVPLPLSPHFS